MGVQKLGLATLSILDAGRVRAAFDQSLLRCQEDCVDRPGDDGVRKVVITVELKPVADERGALDSIDVACDIADSVPKRKTKVFSMRSVRGQGLLFNELSADDAGQGTLDIERPAVGEKGRK